MHTSLQLRVTPDIAYDEARLRSYVSKQLQVAAPSIHAIRLQRRSIDARQRTVFVNLALEVWLDEDPPALTFTPIRYPLVTDAPQAIVVGAGPGGLFAALRLIEAGIRPVVLERGKNVRDRKRDIARISREHIVDAESNYSFGEGGAGAYSDGKLYTRSKKRGNVDRILRIFCQHGASTDILADAHPHIGTDRLPGIIEAMRNTIIGCGGEVHFEHRVDALLLEGDCVRGAVTNNGQEFTGPVILATGHSARDVYRYLYKSGIEIREGRGKYLPAAEYSMVRQVEGRGVYSFCMCPGGFVVPAASGPEQVVVNGMSPSHRGSKWSNSGMVVETRPEDLDGELHGFLHEAMNDSGFATQHHDMDDPANPLRMMYLQEALERATWIQGGRRQTAPAQRMADFVGGRLSDSLPSTSYVAGLIASPLHFWMPRFVTTRLQEAFKAFGRSSRNFLTNEAILIASETRTSAPVRILRDNENLQHTRIAGLFPCGEGAGYAGGIVSAAIDGERCAEALATWMHR